MNKKFKMIKPIEKHGIKHAFGIPGGGSSLDLIDSIIKENITFHTTHFEGSAAIMAGTIGRISGLAGISISIKGPGLANMIPGLAVCHFENFPLIAICESYEADVSNSKAHKRINHNSLTKAVIKKEYFISKMRDSFSLAVNCAEEETPGPVLINLANNKEEEGFDYNQNIKDNKSIRKVLENSNKPLIIAGSLAIRKNLSSLLSSLNIPVLTTVSAKGLIDESLNNSAGVYTGVGLDKVSEKSLISEADLIIGIGLHNTEVLSTKPFSCKSIDFESVIGTFNMGFDFDEIISIETIYEVLDVIKSKSWGSRQIASMKEAFYSEILSTDFLPATVFNILSNYFIREVRLVLDTGYFCTIAEHFWESKRSDLFLCSGNSRYMGTGLPMAIGASLYDSTLPTVVVLGDGGIGMYISELKLAIEHNCPLLILLLSDGGFGSIRTRAMQNKLVIDPLIINNPSWLSIINGFGVLGAKAKNEKEFIIALENWKPKKGPFFIECHFNPEKYQNMVHGIR